ncbi:MAG: carboxylesterase family protein, partial [Acetobacteraceae bacterium]
ASRWPLFDRYPVGPTVDGTLLPAHPFHPRAPAISADIPLLIGDMGDEMAGFLAHDDAVWHRRLTEAEMVARVRGVAGADADQVVEAYRRKLPDADPTERLIAALTDSNFRLRSLHAAERKAVRGGAPVWMYSFRWRTPVFGGGLGATHALDVPFTFDTLDLTNATDGGAEARGLADIVAGVWTRFAHTGRPGHSRLPDWPEYDADRRATMVLDAGCRVEDDPGGEARRLWREIATPE